MFCLYGLLVVFGGVFLVNVFLWGGGVWCFGVGFFLFFWGGEGGLLHSHVYFALLFMKINLCRLFISSELYLKLKLVFWSLLKNLRSNFNPRKIHGASEGVSILIVLEIVMVWYCSICNLWTNIGAPRRVQSFIKE